MSTARDYLAAAQQRADRVAELRDRDVREGIRAAYEVASATDVPRLVAALTAALAPHVEAVAYADDTWGEVPDDWERHYCTEDGETWPCPTVRAITDALTPKENDS